MGNLFDVLQITAHSVVTTSMGYPAAWTPSAGGATQTATVLFNNPIQKAEVTDQDYGDISAKIEFLQGDFDGLYEAVRSSQNEIVTIAGLNYVCYKVGSKFDGKTVIIYIELEQ
jgi:spore germination protein YaaH